MGRSSAILFGEKLPKLMRQAGIPTKGVLHVGANEGQEVPFYRAAGFGKIVLVEPNPEMRPALIDKFVEVYFCAVSNKPGPLVLYLTPGSQQASTLKPLRYAVKDAIDVPVKKLSDLTKPDLNVLVVDVQGSELDVLESGDVEAFDVVVVEAPKDDQLRYDGQASYGQLVHYMQERRFKIIHEHTLPKTVVCDLIFFHERTLPGQP